MINLEMEPKQFLINNKNQPLIKFGLRLPELIGKEVQKIASDQGKSYNLFLADLITDAIAEKRFLKQKKG